MEEKKKRGGRREGAGRKKVGRSTTAVAFKCPKKILEQVVREAKKRGITVSMLVRHIVEDAAEKW